MANTSNTDARRLDSDHCGFVSAQVHRDVVREADENQPCVCYNEWDEMLPIPSVFSYFAKYSDGLDAQRFWSGFRQPGCALKVQHSDVIQLTAVRCWHTPWNHRGGCGWWLTMDACLYRQSVFFGCLNKWPRRVASPS